MLIFSDEKKFIEDCVGNSRSTRFIARKPEDVPPTIRYMGKSKHPQSAMMMGIIGSDRKAFPPIWIKDTLDTTQDKYILSGKVLPMLNSMYGAGNFVWAQDGVPAHTSKATQKYLETKLGSGGFWSKEMWPP